MKFVLSILFFVTFLTTSGQKAIDAVTQKFNDHRINSLQEKLYLHLDRSLYLTGEILWFKIYDVDGTFHKPLDISSVAYVEILDATNEVVLQTKVELKKGFGDGSLFLPATVANGQYQIRAYTNWMRNASAEFYFHKTITIVNTFRKTESENNASKVQLDAQFFPEGGNLVAGLTSKVGFRVVDALGHGIDFTGTLYNQNNESIVSFQPLQFGLGNFSFTPKENEQYHAIITDKNGKTATIKLPSTFDHGFVIQVNDSTESLIKIKVSAKIADAQTDPIVYLFGHARQQKWYSEMRYLKQGGALFLINKKDLPDGISHLTLFDANLLPVCERLYFKQPEKKLNLSIQANQPVYDVRRKVTINLDVKNQFDKTIPSTLSLAVYKNDSLSVETNETIISYLWLTSDLTGIIESPNYYFNTTDVKAKEALDNVMLTHGWRRFSWNNILTKNVVNEFIPESHGHIIKGMVTQPDDSPAQHVSTYLSTPGKNIQFNGAHSNEKGEIRFEMADFYGLQKIIFQTDITKDSTSKIKILNPFSTDYSAYSLSSFRPTEGLKNQLLERSIAMQVQDVYYEDYITRFKNPIPDSIAFYGMPDEKYLLDDYTRFPVMEEIMREYVPGVYVRKNRDGFHFKVLDNVNKAVFQEDPLVMLDGLPIFDIDKIMEFDPLKVKKLDVLTRKYYIGQFTFPGVVSYTTYQGDLGGFQIDPRSISINYEGLQLHREFFSPRYETPQHRSSRLPDQRNLLFWAPTLITNQDGKHQVEFYTSDLTGEYSIVVEGLAGDGSAGHAVSNFTVKNYNN